MNTEMTVVVTGVLYDENNNIKQKFVKHNLITSAGFDFVSNCLGSTTRPKPISQIGVGTNNTAPALGDTNLKALKLKKACTYTHTAGTTSLVFQTVFGAGEATGALVEAGIFTGDDILFDRVVYPVINKEATDTYAMTFEIILKEVSVV